MKKPWPRVFGLLFFVGILLFMAGVFAATFFLTGAVYKLAAWQPPVLLAQVINSLLGLMLVGLIGSLVGRAARSRGWIPEMNVFAPIIEALEKIAKGDFSIRVKDEFRENRIVGQLAESVNTLAVELDQMENLRQEFISNVSHEIQSPLTSIRGFAQALENDQLNSEERRHYLGIIQAESQRLSRITEDLLKLAALESDHARFERKTYALDRQIRSLVLACEPQWAEKNIEMEVSLDEVQVTADEDLLSQVWTNLIHNSLKFTPPQGKVCLELKQRNGEVQFKITDTGIGITEEDQSRVFERFFKADPARTYSNGGSGLGLSIVKKIVDLHEGRIDLESRPGQGATFTVHLPGGETPDPRDALD